jgi:hypothetical protein
VYLEEVDRLSIHKECMIGEPQSQLCALHCDTKHKKITKILMYDTVKAPDYLLFILEQALWADIDKIYNDLHLEETLYPVPS